MDPFPDSIRCREESVDPAHGALAADGTQQMGLLWGRCVGTGTVGLGLPMVSVGRSEEATAKCQLLSAAAVGQKAVAADAHEAGWQYVKQEAANKLQRLQDQGSGAPPTPVVFATQAHLALLK